MRKPKLREVVTSLRSPNCEVEKPGLIQVPRQSLHPDHCTLPPPGGPWARGVSPPLHSGRSTPTPMSFPLGKKSFSSCYIVLPVQSRAPQHDPPFSTGTTLAAYGKWPQWPSLAACLVKLLSPRSSPGGTEACERIVMCWLQCSVTPCRSLCDRCFSFPKTLWLY